MNDDTDSAAGFAPPPMSDADQRLILAVEYGTYGRLIAEDALTREAMQRLNHRLKLPHGRINPNDAAMDNQRRAVLDALHARLVAATGIPLDYWQYPHRPVVPDDLASLDDDDGGEQR